MGSRVLSEMRQYLDDLNLRNCAVARKNLLKHLFVYVGMEVANISGRKIQWTSVLSFIAINKLSCVSFSTSSS
jgi:2,3-bisphosphoglycerate-independent phosphoglycerate mutase